MDSTWRKLTIAALFAIAMAYVESSVVVYLREIFYPHGFSFPMKIIPTDLYLIELGRELATLIMLATVAWIAEKRFLPWFMLMLFMWGVWDIFYYVWLKVFLNWPGDLMTDDILFLIPVPWVGPVLAPVIVSLTFILSAVLYLGCEKCPDIKPGLTAVSLALVGSLLIFVSFIYDFFIVDLTKVANPPFKWTIFTTGDILLLSVVIKYWIKVRQKARL